MRLVEKQSSDEHQQNQTNNGVHHRRLPQLAVIRAHEREHTDEANHQPSRLAREEQVRVAELLFGGDGRGAENHYGAEQAQHQRHSEEPAVGFQSSGHVRLSSPRSCTRRLPLQLMHQMLKDAATVFVILKLVEAGASRS